MKQGCESISFDLNEIDTSPCVTILASLHEVPVLVVKELSCKI